MSVVNLQGKADLKDSAKRLLEEKMDEDYDSVIVLGYKDEAIHIGASQYVNRHTLIGAIMDAMHHLVDEESHS